MRACTFQNDLLQLYCLEVIRLLLRCCYCYLKHEKSFSSLFKNELSISLTRKKEKKKPKLKKEKKKKKELLILLLKLKEKLLILSTATSSFNKQKGILMIPINTDVDITNYFFKWFAWKEDNTSVGLVLTDNTAYFYANENMKAKPQLTDTIPVSRKQRKEIKKYLFSYEDICRNTVQYYHPDVQNNVFYLDGYFQNKHVKKCIVGDSAGYKLFESVMKVLSNQTLTESDYINWYHVFKKPVQH